MFVRMLKLPEEVRTTYDVSSLQCVVHAAAPCPIPVKKQMIEWWGPIIHEYYAGTEGNGFVLLQQRQWLAHPGTVGTPIDCTLHIVGEDGEEVPRRGGHRLLRGRRHVRVPQRPGEDGGVAPPEAAWSTLGDVGYLDEDGFLYLTDRKAYMIISGGVNIYPQEAENVLVTHPKVIDVAVFGVPNDDFGEEVKAVVQPVDDARRRRRGRGARPGADRLLPRAPRRREVPAQRSTSATSSPATPPASSTSAC